jgi:hypothetical protein
LVRLIHGVIVNRPSGVLYPSSVLVNLIVSMSCSLVR